MVQRRIGILSGIPLRNINQMKTIILTIFLLIVGTLFDAIYFKAFNLNGGATIFLAIVVAQCTYMILNKLTAIFQPDKAHKPGLVKRFTRHLGSEITNGRENPEDDYHRR